MSFESAYIGTHMHSAGHAYTLGTSEFCLQQLPHAPTYLSMGVSRSTLTDNVNIVLPTIDNHTPTSQCSVDADTLCDAARHCQWLQMLAVR